MGFASLGPKWMFQSTTLLGQDPKDLVDISDSGSIVSVLRASVSLFENAGYLGFFLTLKKIAHFLGWVNMGEWKAAGWVAQAGYSKVRLWGSAGGKRPPCPVLASHHVFAVCLIMHRFLFSLETFKQP